jgi:hypothetical protein
VAVCVSLPQAPCNKWRARQGFSCAGSCPGCAPRKYSPITSNHQLSTDFRPQPAGIIQPPPSKVAGRHTGDARCLDQCPGRRPKGTQPASSVGPTTSASLAHLHVTGSTSTGIHPAHHVHTSQYLVPPRAPTRVQPDPTSTIPSIPDGN